MKILCKFAFGVVASEHDEEDVPNINISSNTIESKPIFVLYFKFL